MNSKEAPIKVLLQLIKSIINFKDFPTAILKP